MYYLNYLSRNKLPVILKAACLVVLLFSAAAVAQSGTIKGTVTSQNTGEPLAGANVLISGTVLGASTDTDGNYFIGGVPVGTHQISVLYVGYAEVQQTVEVSAGQTITLKFSLAETGVRGQAVVVSASRKPEKITDAPATIEVLTARDVAEYPSFNAGELLARVRGVDYFRAGVLGAGINIRGFNSTFNAKNLQMNDGRISTLIGTGLPLGALSSTVKEDIDHIEVVLGPNAALYGPNAHNGLVNIITKDPRASEGTTVVFGGGNQSIISGRFRHAQVVNEKLAFKVSAEYSQGEEFEYTDSVYIGGVGFEEFGLDRDFTSLKGEAALYFSPSPSSDLILAYGGSNSNNLGITNVGRNQIEDWQVHYFQARYTSPHLFAQVYHTISKTDSTYSHDTRTKNFQALLADTTLNPSEREAAALSFTTPNQAMFIDESRRWNAELQYNSTFGGFNVIGGGQWQRDIANSEGTYLLDNNGDDPIEFDQVGVYAQVEKDFGSGFRAILAARGDNHEVYDFNFLPKVGLLKIGEKGTWRLTYGKGIASPTILNMEASIFSGIILGNSEGFTLADGSKIEPQTVEKIQTFELGYKGILGENKLFVDANAFYNISEDFLSPATFIPNVTHRGDRPLSDFSPFPFVLTYVNFGTVNTFGFDLGLNYYINNNASIAANYSYFDHSVDEDNLEENDFNGDGKVDITDVLINAPKHKLSGGIHFRQNQFFGNVFARWVDAYDFFAGFNVASKTNPDITWRGAPVVEDARVADTFNYGPLGDFVSVDLSAGYRVTNNITASFLVTNLFDSEIREMVVSPFIGRLVSGELKLTLP